MGLVKEFKEFAVKGNVVDMAVGIIIGGAFGKIVSSLVADVLTPPLGFLLGGVDFKDLKFSLSLPELNLKPVTVNYGMFIQNVVDFLIVAFSVFLMVKVVNSTPEPDGSFKDYFIRVPPAFGDGQHTARSAVAWTFEESDEADYAPLVET